MWQRKKIRRNAWSFGTIPGPILFYWLIFVIGPHDSLSRVVSISTSFIRRLESNVHSAGNWTLFLCKYFLLFHWTNMTACHVSENDLFLRNDKIVLFSWARDLCFEKGGNHSSLSLFVKFNMFISICVLRDISVRRTERRPDTIKTFSFQLSVESNSHLLWFCFPPWLIDETRPTFSVNQKQNQNQSRVARAHFPALGVSSTSDWSTEVPAPLVIGQCNCFGFGFTALNWKPLSLAVIKLMHLYTNSFARAIKPKVNQKSRR